MQVKITSMIVVQNIALTLGCEYTAGKYQKYIYTQVAIMHQNMHASHEGKCYYMQLAYHWKRQLSCYADLALTQRCEYTAVYNQFANLHKNMHTYRQVKMLLNIAPSFIKSY
jgi:hypothetical protein